MAPGVKVVVNGINSFLFEEPYIFTKYYSPLKSATNYLDTVIRNRQCKSKPATCKINMFVAPMMHASEAFFNQDNSNYSLAISYDGITQEFLPTYADKMMDMAAALRRLERVGVCQVSSPLPVCDMKVDVSGKFRTYKLTYDGRLVEDFILESSAAKTLNEARDLGLCK